MCVHLKKKKDVLDCDRCVCMKKDTSKIAFIGAVHKMWRVNVSNVDFSKCLLMRMKSFISACLRDQGFHLSVNSGVYFQGQIRDTRNSEF